MPRFSLLPRLIPCFRLALAAALLLGAGALTASATAVAWGAPGSDPTTGLLDASRIPLSTGTAPVRYSNVNNEGYDIVVTTSGLTEDGFGNYLTSNAWWYYGSSPSTGNYATFTFRYYRLGTNVPMGIVGTDLLFEDAESQERFGFFSYFDDFGGQNPVLFNDPMFTFSYGPAYYDAYYEVANAAGEEGGTQTGKEVDMDMDATTISGFTMGVHRQATSAGGVLMMGLGNLSIPPIVQWRQQYFGNYMATTGTAGDSDNPTSDGIPNLLKYAFGLDPTMVETTGLPVVTSSTGYLQVSFNRIMADTDITYVVETSNDMIHWVYCSNYSAAGGDNPIYGDTYEVSNVLTNGVEAIVVSDTVLLSSVPNRYIRVQITRP